MAKEFYENVCLYINIGLLLIVLGLLISLALLGAIIKEREKLGKESTMERILKRIVERIRRAIHVFGMGWS